MKDTRMTADELDLFVSYAYGGPAYRAGRKAQAQAISQLLRGKFARRGETATSPPESAKA